MIIIAITSLEKKKKLLMIIIFESLFSFINKFQ